MAHAVQMGTPRAIALCQNFGGLLKFNAGRWDEAEQALRQALKLSQGLGSASGVRSSLRRLGVLLTARGRLDEARAALEESVHISEHSPLRSHGLIRSYASLAGNRLEAGELEVARHCIELGKEAGRDHGGCTTCNALLIPEAVKVGLAVGDLTGALADVTALEAIAAEYGSLAWTSMAHQARGRYASAAGEPREAAAAWRAALDAFSAYGNLYEAALCQQGLAECLAESSPQDAATFRSEAERTLQRLRTGESPATD